MAARPVGSFMRPIVDEIARRAGIEDFVYPEAPPYGENDDRDDHPVRRARGGPPRATE